MTMSTSTTILPHEIVTHIPGYVSLSPLYAIGYLQTFRAIRTADAQPVFLKLCPTSHLETLARLRHSWTLQCDFSISGALPPLKMAPFGEEGGLLIEYARNEERTSREVFLQEGPYVSSGSGIDALPTDWDGKKVHPKVRTREDIIALLKAFVTVRYSTPLAHLVFPYWKR